jgi:hypothetical protein
MTLAVGTSATHSVMLAWTDKYIGIRGYLGIFNSVAGSVGDMIWSPVIGYLFEQRGPIFFLYITSCCTALCLLLMIVIQLLGAKVKAASNSESIGEKEPLLANNVK